jgi:uncharacterized membrane protein YbhN (UPF0104 family)
MLAAVLVAWLIRSGRFQPRALLDVQSVAALLGVAFLQSIMIVSQSWRWKVVLRLRGLDLPARAALRVGLAGQFAAVWTPAGIGLDGARILDGTQRFPTQRAGVLKAAALDRVFAVAALGVLCAPALLWLTEYGRIWPYLGVANALAIIVLLAKWRDAMQAFVLSCIIHLANIGSIGCAFWALGRAVSVEGIAFAAPLVVLSSLVPLTPLGIGVVDGAAVELFARVAMSGGAESTMLGRAAWIAISLACGAVSAWLGSRDGTRKGEEL